MMAVAALLRQHQVPFNALTVINRHNAKYPLEVYRFLTRELGPPISSSPLRRGQRFQTHGPAILERQHTAPGRQRAQQTRPPHVDRHGLVGESR